MRAGRELIILYAGRQTFKVSGDREQGRNPKKKKRFREVRLQTGKKVEGEKK